MMEMYICKKSSAVGQLEATTVCHILSMPEMTTLDKGGGKVREEGSLKLQQTGVSNEGCVCNDC